MTSKIIFSIFLIVSVIKLYSCSPYNSRNTTYPIDSLNLVTLLDRRYLFSEQALTWMDSLSFCRNYGMELLKVDTVEKNLVIKSYLETLSYITPTTRFFISGHRIGRGDFMWADGTPIDWNIQGWCEGQPNNFNNAQYCLAYYSDEFCWNDCECGPYMDSAGLAVNAANYFICEE